MGLVLCLIFRKTLVGFIILSSKPTFPPKPTAPGRIAEPNGHSESQDSAD